MIEELDQSLRKHGYIGDTKLPVLAYLSLLSALQDKPVSLLVMGPASSGKSYGLACAQRYVPTEAYEQFEGMSERALVYMGEQLDLRHKTLIIQEAAGMSGGTGRAFLRQLLTEGQIRYATVQSTRDGLQGTELPVVEGPCGLIMTTTATRIHHEDQSRMLTYNIEEGSEQIRAVLMAQASGEGTTEPTSEELRPFHDKYREMRENPSEVAIPFLHEVGAALPASHPRILRDFPKVITLVKTVALLHADSRERDESGAVIATVEDYEQVRHLVEDTLSHGLEVSVSPGVRGVVEAVREMEQASNNPPGCLAVSQREIANYLGVDPSVVSRNVHRAVDLELLENDNPGQGKVAQLRLGRQELPTGSVLPVLE